MLHGNMSILTNFFMLKVSKQIILTFSLQLYWDVSFWGDKHIIFMLFQLICFDIFTYSVLYWYVFKIYYILHIWWFIYYMCYHYTMVNISHSILVLQHHRNRRYWWPHIIIAFQFLSRKCIVEHGSHSNWSLKKLTTNQKTRISQGNSTSIFPGSSVSSMTA